ncbi:MAG: hypothetical protein N3B13_04250 [Deltaproteobacteria bacterium]|nr:hypothetical protein [Deltaproteobacteria bacterium]
MTKYKLFTLMFILLLPCFLNAQGVKVEDEPESVIKNITEQEIEEEIIRHLDLLKNYNLVENLSEYEEISEIMEYEEDE